MREGLAAAVYGVTDGVANVVPIDFAGGTVVHINAGMAGLVLAIVVGKRLGFGKSRCARTTSRSMIGAGLLWFGWFGFNAGSELAADGTAALVWSQHDGRHLCRHAGLAHRGEGA